jgi:hypothetical protein
MKVLSLVQSVDIQRADCRREIVARKGPRGDHIEVEPLEDGITAAILGPEALPERPPTLGELVQLRSRRWLVEDVVEPARTGQSPLVRLACADDDAQGQALEVFWDYELDRRILEEEGWQDLAAKGFDAPRQFAAFFHTLRWNCITATDVLAEIRAQVIPFAVLQYDVMAVWVDGRRPNRVRWDGAKENASAGNDARQKCKYSCHGIPPTRVKPSNGLFARVKTLACFVPPPFVL